jgi:hypothetical protein
MADDAKAGVEFGLSSVEKIKAGNVEAQQKDQGDKSAFRREEVEETAAGKNGKSFKFLS